MWYLSKLVRTAIKSMSADWGGGVSAGARKAGPLPGSTVPGSRSVGSQAPCYPETKWKCSHDGACGKWKRGRQRPYSLLVQKAEEREPRPWEKRLEVPVPLSPSHLPPGEGRKRKRFCQRSKNSDSISFAFAFGLGWVCSPSNERSECLGEAGSWGAG